MTDTIIHNLRKALENTERLIATNRALEVEKKRLQRENDRLKVELWRMTQDAAE